MKLVRPALPDAAVAALLAGWPMVPRAAVSPQALPPLLSYVAFERPIWTILAGGIVLLASLLRESRPYERPLGVTDKVTSHRLGRIACLACLALVAFLRVPEVEKSSAVFAGDEPKYLRIAKSLWFDLDADIGSGRTELPNGRERVRQLRNVALAARDTTLALGRPVEVPEGHDWHAGNWTVRGLDGGLYHLQPPGLPALVALALSVGNALAPNVDRDAGVIVEAFLSLLWILAGREIYLLIAETTKSRPKGAVAVALLFSTAPVFIGGYQLFPEALVAFIFPWLLRRLRSEGTPPTLLDAACAGGVTGSLLWIHPKLTVVALLFVMLAFVRKEYGIKHRALFASCAAVIAFTALLYCFRISGLFRPEGLYIREASEYSGAPNPFSIRFASGAVKALIGARDGLFVFAPVLLGGLVALPRALALRTRVAAEMLLLFCAVWLTSAVHEGASLGSPARLLFPVAFVPAFFLVDALLDEKSNRTLLFTTIFLFAVSARITLTGWSDWRRVINPYKGMFEMATSNFEPSLPGNAFSDASYVADLLRAAFFFVTLATLALNYERAKRTSPAAWGLGLAAVVTVLATVFDGLAPR